MGIMFGWDICYSFENFDYYWFIVILFYVLSLCLVCFYDSDMYSVFVFNVLY